MVRVRWGLGIVVILTMLVTGCAMTMPADPDGTLDRIDGGVMRVGVTENAPWVLVDDADDPSGSEQALISEFADRFEARVEWTPGSEAALLKALDRGELDIVIGGFLDDTPWTDLGAVTRPYLQTSGPEGTEKHVMIVRMGENRLLLELERFLFEETGS